MALLHALSYGSAIFAFCFIVLSLASGLLWISELIEENSRTAKTVGKRGIYAIILLHLVLYRTDSLPLAQTLFSIFCHVVYLQNFSPAWPAISLASPSFVASCVLVIADHFIWFFEFARRTQEARHTAHRAYGRPQTIHAPAFADIATFFGICVWLAPLFLFLSLSANDNALPVQSGAKTSSSSESPSPVPLQTKQHSSLFRSLLRPKRATTDEGILSPRLAFSPSNGPLRVPSLNNLPTSRPTSPVIVSTHSTPGMSTDVDPFGIGPPPRRGTSPQPQAPSPQRPLVGLGMRRVQSAVGSSSAINRAGAL